MNIKRLYSADIYKKIMDAEYDKKDDIYRYEMMMPFKGKWDCYHIPLKAQYEGGYDIIMANKMMGLLPPDIIDKGWKKAIDMYLKQISLVGGIPFSVVLPKAANSVNADMMSITQIHQKSEKGYADIEKGNVED